MASKERKTLVGKSPGAPRTTQIGRGTKVEGDPEEMAQVKKLLAAGDPDGVLQELERGRCRVVAVDEIGQSIGMTAANFGYGRLLEYIIARKAPVGYKNSEGYTALISACRAGRPEAVHFLLSKKADVNDRAPNPGANWTPLHWAAINGFTEIVGVLLKAKASVNHPDSVGRTAVHWACSHGHLAVVQVLASGGANLTGAIEAAHEHILVRQHVSLALELNSELLRAAQSSNVDAARSALDKGAAVDTKDDCGWSALMWAALNGQLDMARLLVEGYEASLDLTDEYGRTAHDLADGIEGSQGSWADVKRYLEEVELVGREILAGAARGDDFAVERAIEISPDERGGIDREDSPGWTAAHWACSRGEPHTLKRLLDRKTDVEKKDSRGLTCALVAACYGRTRILDMLAEFKANLDVKASHGESMVFMAARHCQAESISWILQRAAKDKKIDQTNLKQDAGLALHEATSCCHIPSVQALLDAEVDMTILGPNGQTVLTLATRQGHLPTIETLCARASPKDFTVANDDGLTPLGVAGSQGNSVMLEALLDAKANPAYGGQDGLSTLHLAAIGGHLDACQLLLLAKADPEAKDLQGRTPLDCIPDLNTPEPEKSGAEEAGSEEEDSAEEGGNVQTTRGDDTKDLAADGNAENASPIIRKESIVKDRKSSIKKRESKDSGDAPTKPFGKSQTEVVTTDSGDAQTKSFGKSQTSPKSKAKDGSPNPKTRASIGGPASKKKPGKRSSVSESKRASISESKRSSVAPTAGEESAEEVAAALAAAEAQAQELAAALQGIAEEKVEPGPTFDETMGKYLRQMYPERHGIEDMPIPRRPKRTQRHAEVERALMLATGHDRVRIWARSLTDTLPSVSLEATETGTDVRPTSADSNAEQLGEGEEGELVQTMMPDEAMAVPPAEAVS